MANEYFITGKGKTEKDLYFGGYDAYLQMNLPIWCPDPNDEHIVKFHNRKTANEELKYLKERYGYQNLKVIKKERK